MRRAVGILLMVVALIAVAWVLYYSPQNTITTTITTTTTEVSFKGNWGWEILAAGILILVTGVAGELLILTKPKPSPAKPDTPEKQSVARV